MSPWVLLGVAVVVEVGATIALRLSQGLTRPVPTLVVVVGYGVAFWLLSRIVQQLPTSVTYAVWAGAGIALVAIVGVVAFGEAVTPVKVASLVLVVLGIVGLHLQSGADEVASRPGGPAAETAAHGARP